MVGREFRGREEVKKKTLTGREDVHPQNELNGLILNWCIGGCWFTPAKVKDILYIKATCLSVSLSVQVLKPISQKKPIPFRFRSQEMRGLSV